MNDLTGERIGFVVTGSFCTFSAAFAQAKLLREAGAELTPIFSEHAAAIDTRFGTAAERVAELEEICGKPAIRSIAQAEPLGPRNLLDLLVVAPCTANTAAKLANGITDTTATMAVKSMLRRQKPIVLAIATNDALRASAKNIGLLLTRSTITLCPCGRTHRRRSRLPLVADFHEAAGNGGSCTGRQTDPANFRVGGTAAKILRYAILPPYFFQCHVIY